MIKRPVSTDNKSALPPKGSTVSNAAKSAMSGRKERHTDVAVEAGEKARERSDTP
jgi:hypothetical protein